MYFVPVVIVLSIESADAVDANAATHLWRRQLDWVNYLANYERAGTLEVFNQLETKIAVFIVEPNLRNITFGHHMRLLVPFDVRDVHGVKLTRVKGFRNQRTCVRFADCSSVNSDY